MPKKLLMPSNGSLEQLRRLHATNPCWLPSATEMRAADSATIAAGTSSLELMERAGAAITKVLLERFPISQFTAVIACGPGNNGGDGFVVARLLKAQQMQVLALSPNFAKRSQENQAQLELAKSGGVTVILGGALELIDCAASSHTSLLLIDALLGTALENQPRGEILALIAAVNQIRGSHPDCKVISVDIPSGVDATAGKCFNPHVKADLTITLAAIKSGMVQEPALSALGEIAIAPIGITLPDSIELRLATTHSLPCIPHRSNSTHKGDFGRVIVIAGSRGMPGAAALAGLAALRAGSGVVEVTEFCEQPGFAPEIIRVPLACRSLGEATVLADLIARLRSADACVIGPGLFGHEIEHRKDTVSELIWELLKAISKTGIRSVIDADALTVLAERTNSQVSGLSLPNCILTPHPGEAARLLSRSGATASDVQSDRYQAVREISAQNGSCVVLKGASTVIYQAKKGLVNSSGGPHLATAGSGDVLAGVLGSLLAQSWSAAVSLLDIAALGVYLHGLAGDIAARRGVPIIASDIISALPQSFRAFADEQ